MTVKAICAAWILSCMYCHAAETVLSPGHDLSAAIRQAAPGDIIALKGGCYCDPVELSGITGPITVRAAAGERPVLDGTIPLPVSNAWKKGAGGIWSVQLSQDIWQLFDGHEFLQVARWPDCFIGDEHFWNQKGSYRKMASRSTFGVVVDERPVSGVNEQGKREQDEGALSQGRTIPDDVNTQSLARTGVSMKDAIAILNIGSWQTSAQTGCRTVCLSPKQWPKQTTWPRALQRMLPCNQSIGDGMSLNKRTVLLLAVAVFAGSGACREESADREITRDELRDRIAGFWYGQLVGNFMGYPFESQYVDASVPVLVDRYYDYRDAGELNIVVKDIRGVIRHVTGYYGGAVSDDDTDIELVTLHAVEKYGLDLTYPEITEMWKRHINRNVWAANAEARRLMDEGLIPPATGSKKNNRRWHTIDPQLVNEIWSVFYPGMTDKAVARAEWGARITSDDWGTHPTRFYAYICSRAVFESDTRLLVEAALEVIPEDSPFREGVVDVLKWHREHEDWRETRQRIHEKYFRYQKDGYKAPVAVISSLCNGLCGALALLYGEGDFVKTVGIAVSAGYDCDNQAATCGGIIGLMKGAAAIPDRFTKEMPNGEPWATPFNNRYLNITRDNLPNVFTLDDLIDRTLCITEQAILEEGGRKEEKDGRTVFMVPCKI